MNFERPITHFIAVCGASALGLILAVLGIGCSAKSAATPTSGPSPVERGQYLVAIAGCDDCHTPFTLGPNGPEPDMSRRLSGHPEELVLTAPAVMPDGWLWAGAGTNTAFAGPWGVSFATNLTPDMETGFGIYTEESFMAAIRAGKHMGAGRPIMPPMPWPAYRHMTDDDLQAVFAYLQTLSPVRNRVPEVQPPPT